MSIEYGDQVCHSFILHSENEIYTCSWKNEFDEWLGGSQMTVNVYLFNNEDIRHDDREKYLRRVSISFFFILINKCEHEFFSGTKKVVFSSWVMKCIVN